MGSVITRVKRWVQNRLRKPARCRYCKSRSSVIDTVPEDITVFKHYCLKCKLPFGALTREEYMQRGGPYGLR